METEVLRYVREMYWSIIHDNNRAWTRKFCAKREECEFDKMFE